MADVGQQEDFDKARQKALSIGAKQVFVEDLKEKFLMETIVPALKGNCMYEGVYLMGTALARPVIAQRQIELAIEHGCQYVSHGCTGKGNDQVRFELAYLALCPSIKIVAPWKCAEFYSRFQGRTDLLAYAAAKSIPVSQTPSKPWSTDENMFHISYEAGLLEDPEATPPEDMWQLTRSLETSSPNGPEHVRIHFDQGVPVRLETLPSSKADLKAKDTEKVFEGTMCVFEQLQLMARLHGIGRLDIVENRFIGIKSRGCYESPAATILWKAHADLEGLVMDREVRQLRDEMSRRLAVVIYNGLWFSPERRLLQHSIDITQQQVSGSVDVQLYKGNVVVQVRRSSASQGNLYNAKLASMDEHGGFSPSDSDGFIRIQSIRLTASAQHQSKSNFN